jgi:hypothetical protein
MNPALLLGAVTGAMTSTLAMDVVTEVAHSGVPALGYAGTYTLANVLLTFASALMMCLQPCIWRGAPLCVGFHAWSQACGADRSFRCGPIAAVSFD